jgi:hypothetical protein
MAFESFVRTNNTRIAWRTAECAFTSHDGVGTFAVNFAPDVPEPDKVTVLIRGLSLDREEHDVSMLKTHVQNVKVNGTTVSGEYRCTLSDADKNAATGGSMSINVIAQLKPKTGT